jgi:hypothetical protein
LDEIIFIFYSKILLITTAPPTAAVSKDKDMPGPTGVNSAGTGIDHRQRMGFGEYITKFYETVSSIPTDLQKSIQKITDRYKRDQPFWAPESVTTNEINFKQQVHRCLIAYTTKVYDADVGAYVDKNPEVSVNEAQKLLDVSFGEKYTWSAQYAEFSNTYK